MLRICHCRQCRMVRAKSNHGAQPQIKAAKHSVRTDTRVKLRMGEFELLKEKTDTVCYA